MRRPSILVIGEVKAIRHLDVTLETRVEFMVRYRHIGTLRRRKGHLKNARHLGEHIRNG
jgi:hypothetical protein